MPVALAFATLRIAHGSPSALALVLGSFVTAQTLFLPLGGVWGDRLPRQLVMLVADGVRAAVQITMAALLLGGRAEVWEIVLLNVVQGAGLAFFQPASTALVPQTVSVARLQQANALLGLARSVSAIGGPVAAGIIVAVLDPGWAFAANAASFLVSAATLAALRLPPAGPAPTRQGVLRELAVGWREVSHRPWYFLTVGAHALWNLAIAAFFVLGPVVASRHLGGPTAWGFISASIAVGSVAGGLVALRVQPGRPLVVANLAINLGALQLVSLALALPTPAVMAFAILGFGSVTFLNEVWATVMQQLIPADVLARVSSFDWALSLVAMPAGYAIMGAAAAWIGIPGTLVAAAFVLAVPNLLVVLVPGVRAIRRLPDGTITTRERR